MSFLSGAGYSLLPDDVWRDLGLEPQETLKFVLADGTKIERQASECKIRLNGKERHTPVILGEAGDEPLLGVITLENLGLVLDPFKRTLQAMKLRARSSGLTPSALTPDPQQLTPSPEVDPKNWRIR